MDREYFSRQLQMPEQIPTERIAGKRILIAGAGAVGAAAAVNLLNTGFQQVCILDFDTLERSNLSRGSFVLAKEDLGRPKADAMARSLRERFAARADIQGLNEDIRRVGSVFTGAFDAVLSTLDDLSATAYLSAICRQSGTLLVTAATQRLDMLVGVYPPDQDAPCFGCGLGAGTEARRSCDQLYARAAADGHLPSTQISSSLAGAFGCLALVRALGREAEHHLLHYRSGSDSLKRLHKHKDPCCPCGATPPGEGIPLPGGTALSLGEFFRFATPHIGKDGVLPGGCDYVHSDRCSACGLELPVGKPLFLLRTFPCPRCGQPLSGEQATVFGRYTANSPSEILALPLYELGFPRAGVFGAYHPQEDRMVYFSAREDLPGIFKQTQ